MKAILFNTEMVRAILDGRKTVTRRVVKQYVPENVEFGYDVFTPEGCISGRGTYENSQEKEVYGEKFYRMPYRPGDVIYVRETWNYGYIDGTDEELASQNWFEPVPLDYAGIMKHCCHYVYRADFTAQEESELGVEHDDGSYRMDWCPSVHMPKEAARIFLRVKVVRVERLHDVTSDEIYQEGIQADYDITAFHEFWDTTIKPADRTRYGWYANPWVWVIEFERISREEAEQ